MTEDDVLHDAAETFAAVSHPFRLQILDALEESEVPIRYSSLMDAVGTRNSGQLNYHLSELVGRFVAQTEGGYRLTYQGKKLLSTILAGRYAEGEFSYATAVEGRCRRCLAAALQLRQTDQFPRIVCDECEYTERIGPFPIGGWETRPTESVPEAVHNRTMHNAAMSIDRVCHDCASHMEAYAMENAHGYALIPVFDCVTCTNYSPVPYPVISWLHAEVREFFEAREMESSAVRFWRLHEFTETDGAEIRSTNPPKAVVRFGVDDDTCEVTIGRDFTVERIETTTAY